jgi:hypothetical protein
VGPGAKRAAVMHWLTAGPGRQHRRINDRFTSGPAGFNLIQIPFKHDLVQKGPSLPKKIE